MKKVDGDVWRPLQSLNFSICLVLVKRFARHKFVQPWQNFSLAQFKSLEGKDHCTAGLQFT